jgi:hypothetical protein
VYQSIIPRTVTETFRRNSFRLSSQRDARDTFKLSRSPDTSIKNKHRVFMWFCCGPNSQLVLAAPIKHVHSHKPLFFVIYFCLPPPSDILKISGTFSFLLSSYELFSSKLCNCYLCKRIPYKILYDTIF